MSVNYKAQIVEGYELNTNWNKIVDEDFFEEYIDNFITTSVYRDGFQVFGVVLEEVEEGCFVEYNDHYIYLSVDQFTLLHEFRQRYPKAIRNISGSRYLICKEC